MVAPISAVGLRIVSAPAPVVDIRPPAPAAAPAPAFRPPRRVQAAPAPVAVPAPAVALPAKPRRVKKAAPAPVQPPAAPQEAVLFGLDGNSLIAQVNCEEALKHLFGTGRRGVKKYHEVSLPGGQRVGLFVTFFEK